MLPKLHPYIAFTLLANTLIVAGLLPPAHAKSAETIESRNPVEKVALNSSVKTCANRALLQDNAAEIYSTQPNQGEVIPSAFTSKTSGVTTTIATTDIEQQALIQYFDSRPIGNEIEVLNGSELDLDSILAYEFEQEGILLAKDCCF
jgi:predicted acyl esterase